MNHTILHAINPFVSVIDNFSTGNKDNIKSFKNNRWSIRATNDGVLAIIDNNGTIVSKLDKGISGILEGEVKLIDKSSFYNIYGYLLPYIISFIIIFITLLRYIWKKLI